MGNAAVEVPVFADHAFETGGGRDVLVVAQRLRQVAVGIELRLLVGVAIEFGAGGVALVVGAEAVGLAAGQRQLAVEPQVDVPRQAVAHHVVALVRGIGKTVETGAVGRVAIFVLGAATNEPALFAQARAGLGGGHAVLAVGGGSADGVLMGVKRAVAGGHFPALGRVVEDDVDHPGNRVGTVLRTGAVAQHFDAFDRADGDRVEVHRRRAATDFRRVVDHRRSVTALAVDQHQHLVRTHAAQLCGAHMVGAT